MTELEEVRSKLAALELLGLELSLKKEGKGRQAKMVRYQKMLHNRAVRAELTKGL
jgi:hypothetical protein